MRAAIIWWRVTRHQSTYRPPAGPRHAALTTRRIGAASPALAASNTPVGRMTP
ncbi:MAG: hypothetical protein WAW82_12050 [Candidatus Lutibacillus vidarii]|nr:hypothetical protein [Dermatophilaceae bacterium]HRB99495.1 hypothetical protein [Dermatophilaceae bacterium]